MKKLLMIFMVIAMLSLVSAATSNIKTESHGVLSSGTALGEIAPRGMKINITNQIFLYSITVPSGTTATRGIIYDSSFNILGTGTINATGIAPMPKILLSPSNVYYVAVDSNGSPFDSNYRLGVSYPIAGTNLNWVAGLMGTTDTASEADGIINVSYYTDLDRVELINPINYGGVSETITEFRATQNISASTNLNMTLYLYNSSNALINQTTNIVSGTTNVLSSWNVSGLAMGQTYTWNVYGCRTNATAGFTNICSFAPQNFTFSYGYTINSSTYNAATFETKREEYILNITMLSGKSINSATLYLNGTAYQTTIANPYGTFNKITASLDVPVGTGTKNLYYSLLLSDGTTLNLPSFTQTVSLTNISLCGSPHTVPFINFTFKDEATLTSINASLPLASFEFYLGGSSVTKSITYSNTVNLPSYAFCITPPQSTFSIIPYIQYKQGTAYPQRVWNPSITNYTNSTTNQILYLASSTDGSYVTYQVVNSADQLISGVEVIATRNIGGINVIVGQGTTTASGSVTFWLNPDFQHTLTFSKEGYTTYSFTDAPTQSSYTITLAGNEPIVNSSSRGITYTITPSNSSLLNDTTYAFGYILHSSYWDVSDYGFSLRLANGTRITGSNTGIEDTQLTKSYNVGNQSIIYMDYYYVINGVYTNATRVWVISNTDFSGFGIATFFSDLNRYLDSGLFGIDEFGRYMLVLIIIIMVSGIVSYKYGYSSPIAVTTIIFGTIFFFDVVVGLIPAIRNINHLLTYVSALALILSIFREVKQ